MTFIDVTGGDPSPGLIAGYSILSVVSLACTAWAIHLGRSRLHYNASFSARILFPLALGILTLENIALAISGLIYEKLENDGVDGNYDSYLFMKAVFIMQPFEVPLLLIVVFELTYLVHKSRSVNFCGMYFDEGRRVHNTAVMSCMLRNSIRSLAVVLLVMGLLVNLDVIQDNVTIDALVGRAGWHSFFTMEGNAKAKIHLLLSLLPVAVLVVVCFYLSVMLWRYGTQSSMVVHSSMCNPWFYPFFGTVAMGVGQIFGPELYPVMSNAGMLIFIIALLALMAEVDKDMVETHKIKSFLMQVANIGDEISVTPHPRAVPSVRQAYIEQPSNIPTFRRFARQSIKNEERHSEVADISKPSTNGNKSTHSVSTDITEPTSNVKKSTAPANEHKSVTISKGVRSSLSVEETINEEKGTDSSNREYVETKQPESDAVMHDIIVDKSPEIGEDDLDKSYDTQQTDNCKVAADAAERHDEESETAATSKSIMKGMLNDVQVLIDEEIGEAEPDQLKRSSEEGASRTVTEDKPAPS